MNFNDGTNCKIPLSYQVNVEDWWAMPQNVEPAESEIVWKGQNETTKKLGRNILIFKYTWENPLSNIDISAIDFVSSITTASPYLIAITIE